MSVAVAENKEAQAEFVKDRRRALNQYQAGEPVTDDLFRALIKEHGVDYHAKNPMVNLCPICADA